MINHESERPWQIMPAKIIELALEHAKKVDDFDHQVAFLLLDIGVETALKAYLINKKHDVEKIVFPELLKRVKEELSREKPNFVQQLEDVTYLHGIRNKLYHQGDGVKPTTDNLNRYCMLSKRIVEELLEVDLIKKRKGITLTFGSKSNSNQIELKDIAETIGLRLKYFRESCAIITEKIRPNYGSREFAMKLKYIFITWADVPEHDLELRIVNQKNRLEKFNELMGKEIEDQKIIDFFFEDVNHLYVWFALQTTSPTPQEDWQIYIDVLRKQPHLLSNWEKDIISERLTVEQVRHEIEQIISWLKSTQERLDELIDKNMENIYRSYDAVYDAIDQLNTIEWFDKNYPDGFFKQDKTDAQ